MAFSFNVELLIFVFDCVKKTMQIEFLLFKKSVLIPLLDFAIYATFFFFL
jgi:hypothetical protein